MGSPELKTQRAEEGNALHFPTWSPALPMSGLSFPLGPGTEQALRDRVVMNLESLYLKRNRLPHQPQHSTLGAASRWPDHRSRGFDSPVLYPSCFLQISQRAEHPQHPPSFWGHRSHLRSPLPELSPPEQVSTSLYTI